MITFCTSEEFTLQIEGVGRTEYNIILTQEIGKDMAVDDIVTETGDNPVKSSGIWEWVTGLFTAFSDTLKTIATSGVHNDATERDAANSHPATAITVDETPVADFTPAVQGNNLQQVTNKVAGLQFTKIVEINLSEDVTQIIETFDRNYNELIIYQTERKTH